MSLHLTFSLTSLRLFRSHFQSYRFCEGLIHRERFSNILTVQMQYTPHYVYLHGRDEMITVTKFSAFVQSMK